MKAAIPDRGAGSALITCVVIVAYLGLNAGACPCKECEVSLPTDCAFTPVGQLVRLPELVRAVCSI